MENLDWFNKIAKDHQDFIDSEKKAEFHITDQFQNLNIETLHFIFELLQNADDQNAKKGTFIFSDNHIKFFHNGNKFNKSDVKEICSFAAHGLKRGDNQKIGKFGLGFKSVLQFTDEPKVFSYINNSPFHFAIKDKCVPHIIDDPKHEIIDEVDKYPTRSWGVTSFIGLRINLNF